MVKQRFRWIFLMAGLLSLAGYPCVAQNYSIDWYSIDGGGGTSTGGNYSLTGTIGQADAGTMSGGNYTLTGGFLSILAVVQTPGAPELSIQRVGGAVEISWPAAGSNGFVLQETGALAAVSSSTIWNDHSETPVQVGENMVVTISSPVGNRFFRLQQE